MPATQVPGGNGPLTRGDWLRKAAVFLVVLAGFGLFYGWASPRAFPPDARFGFGFGMLHGALMPMALPSLALGRDVEIFATRNSGRSYKLGYVVGINLCGLVFFGSAFWRPGRRRFLTGDDEGRISNVER